MTAKSPSGEDVGPAFREQEIDFRRPAADALDLGQEFDCFLVVIGQVFEVEFSGKDQLGEASDVARLLPRHAGGAQFLIGGGEKLA